MIQFATTLPVTVAAPTVVVVVIVQAADTLTGDCLVQLTPGFPHDEKGDGNGHRDLRAQDQEPDLSRLRIGHDLSKYNNELRLVKMH